MNQDEVLNATHVADAALSASPSFAETRYLLGPAEVTPVITTKRSVCAAWQSEDSSAGSFTKKRGIAQDRCESPSSSSSSSEDSVDAAILLTAMRSIASREINSSSQQVTPLLAPSRTLTPALDQLTLPDLSSKANGSQVQFNAPELQHRLANSENEGLASWLSRSNHESSSRMRAVSFDCGAAHVGEDSPPLQRILDLTTSSPSQESMESSRSATPEIKHPPVIHTYVTPTGKRKKIEGPATIVVAPGKSKANKPSGALKTILRRKFSWKNYPELEAFLIANRDEYLRHSTLNYTVQQKQFNNRLTEQLIELAGQHGYVFDPSAFNFVTIRDRIRCYFKSYVQSSKKRGLIIGYAAKRAGLVTDRDLESSASTAGKIIVPT